MRRAPQPDWQCPLCLKAGFSELYASREHRDAHVRRCHPPYERDPVKPEQQSLSFGSGASLNTCETAPSMPDCKSTSGQSSPRTRRKCQTVNKRNSE